MKTSLILIAVVLLALEAPAVALAADASSGIPDACQLNWVRDHRDGLGTVASGYPVLDSPSGVRWAADSPGSGTWEIQIGDAYDTPTTGAGMLGCYGFPTSAGLLNWSGYTSFSMKFTNHNPFSGFSIQLIINTGATGSGEPNNLYSTALTPVAPGGALSISMPLAGVANLNHVSNVSFKLVCDLDRIEVTVEPELPPVPSEPITWGLIKSRYGE
jgi:hypothetical protein